jgi:hypothetical protein
MESARSSPPPPDSSDDLELSEYAGETLEASDAMGFSDTAIPFEGDAPTVDEEHAHVAPVTSIWQQPFTQKVLPAMTSVLLHLGVFIVFILTYKVVQVIHHKEVEQYIIPDASITEGPEGGIPNAGMGNDPTRASAQDKFPDVPPDAHGLADNDNKTDLLTALKGGGESASDLAVGQNDTLGKHSIGVGLGAGIEGSGDEGGAAKFGIAGGGNGIGLKSNFAGTGGNARRIVYVLDATGSMMSEFDDLRSVLRQSVAALKPPQAFNVVFIQEEAPPPPAPDLLFVTPENKKLVEDYVDKFTPRGPTDPLPALKTAFAMHPQLVYFLIDPSDFPDKNAVIDLVHRESAGGKVKMNIIAFEGHDAANEQFLSKLSKETGGQFKFITGADLRKFETAR